MHLRDQVHWSTIQKNSATLNTIVDEIINIDDETKVLLKKSISRINEISNSLLEKSHFENVDISLPKIEQIKIAEYVNEIIEQKRIEFRNAIIEINVVLTNPNTLTKIDKIEFGRVLSNLINNSIESFSTKIIVTIELFKEENIKIIIRDNGSGIPDNLIEILGKNEFTTKKTGNGLGVMHAVSSVKSWGGELLIASHVNGGAIIQIILPKVREHEISIYENLTILLDNDELVRYTWQFKAKKKAVNFLAFNSFEDLKKIIHLIPRNTNFFIDSDLGDSIKGEDVALNLHTSGFNNISMASGNNNEYFKNLIFLKSVRDKTPPWS